MPAQAELPWLLMAQLHPTAVHPRGQLSIPAPRGTSGAIAQQRVGLLLPDKDSTTPHDQGSNASAVSTTSVAMQKSDGFLHYPPASGRPPLYLSIAPCTSELSKINAHTHGSSGRSSCMAACATL